MPNPENIEVNGPQQTGHQPQAELLSRREALVRAGRLGLEVAGVYVGFRMLQNLGGRESTVEASGLIPVIPVESRREAADRFGGDAWSRNRHNWFINQSGGATLRPNPNGDHSRLITHRPSFSGRGVVEGWWQVKRNGIDAIPIVVNPNDVRRIDIRSGTVWVFSNENAERGFHQVRKQLIERERREQPGTIVHPICAPDVPRHGFVGVVPFRSRLEAARKYGADRYSRNPRNWFINQFGGATLRPDPRGLHHRVQNGDQDNGNGVWEGWEEIRQTDLAFNAIGFVSIANTPRMDLRGGTVWKPLPRQRRELFDQLMGQLTEREQREQPGVLVVPICN